MQICTKLILDFKRLPTSTSLGFIGVFEDKGVKVFIDAGAVMYLLGTEMDYKTEQFSSSFVFKNPNETERCGCGESFKI